MQLPAVNTPQSDWVLSRVPGKARPVAPVYQPEPAARAVVHAAFHARRREYRADGSTAVTLIANAVAPALLDRHLARTGSGSQHDEGEQGAAVNLWVPADGPHGRAFGAHGRFDDEAVGHTPQDWLPRNRARLGTALAVGAGLVAARRLTRLLRS